MLVLAAKWVFERQAAERAAARASRRAEARFAAFVRRRARSSIRRRKKPAAPGSPPSSHTDQLKLIFFARDEARKETVVGPIKLGKPGRAPATLEAGGVGVVKGKPRQYRGYPFMRPALEAEAPKFAGLFRGSVET